MIGFVFMLTRNDRTVQNAAEHLETALACGIRHIGFKDIGLPVPQLQRLRDRIREAGGVCYLEVVSEDRASEVASARAARRIGVDVLLGGTNADSVLPELTGSGIRYMPFPGRISGLPSVLHGPAGDILASAARLAALDGVHGLDLLAWRFAGDVPALIRAVCAVTPKPVIVAGSVDGPDRIAELAGCGAAGFTVGTAALDGVFPARAPGLAGQLASIRQASDIAFPAG